MSNAIYTPKMPASTAELAEAWQLHEQWLFEIQVEQAIAWLESQLLHKDTRAVIYQIPDFWEWFLAEWGATDEMLLLLTSDDPDYLKIGGNLVKHSRAAKLSYYIKAHGKALQDASLESIPRAAARRIGQQLENHFYTTLNPS